MMDHLTRAVEVASDAYCPYSQFHVGAVVVAEDGRSWSGCNVENAAYGSAICAEVNAIASAVADGHVGPSTVYVACLDAADLSSATPCGNCRQVMGELGVTKVVLTIDGTESITFTMEDLLPHGFQF